VLLRELGSESVSMARCVSPLVARKKSPALRS
jgi:hypothetical protein